MKHVAFIFYPQNTLVNKMFLVIFFGAGKNHLISKYLQSTAI